MDKNKIPILLISFNRPELTKGAIENLRTLKPSVIFFSVDGPRNNIEEDSNKIADTKNLIKSIDWECIIYTKFGDKNYGSGLWPYMSISWALSITDVILVVKDDVRIAKNFYEAVHELHHIYKDNEDIFAICASNIIPDNNNGYFLTKYFSGWGWLTWANKWNKYDFNISRIDLMLIFKIFSANNFNPLITLYFFFNWILIKKHKLNAWDYQINLLIFKENLKVIKFNQNLSLNVGVGNLATHTKFLPRMSIGEIPLNIINNQINMNVDKNLERNWRKARILFILRSIKLRFLNK